MAYSIIASSNGRAVQEQLLADASKHPQALSNALSKLAYQAKIDSVESAKKELDRPKPYTLKAIIYKKSKRTTLVSSVLINPNNEYLPTVVYGGTRRNKGRVLVPSRKLRTDRYGNLGKARRKRILASPKTFKVTRGGKTFLMRRIGKRVEFVASLEKSTEYRKSGYWKFHDSNLRTYDRRFGGLFNAEYTKALTRKR